MASQDATNRYNGQLIPLFSLTVMNASTLPDVEQARFNMVEQQVRPWDVLDANVLQALFDVRREQFVPPALRALAFSDLEIPLQINGVDSRQNMLAPKIEARLAQELQLTKSDCVLEIGTGSGYQAALLGYLAQQVTSVEIDSRLVTFAQQNLQMNNVTNVKVETGDARNGWGSTEYDAILVTGSVPAVPDALKYQLRVGGRLVVIVGQAPVMTACRITRTTAASFETVNLFETVIKPRRDGVPVQVLIRPPAPSPPSAGMRGGRPGAARLPRNIMRVRSLTALLVFTCAASVGPSRAHAADDLMQVWRTALGSDPVYAAARQLPRQPGKEPQARAGLLPQISAEAAPTAKPAARRDSAWPTAAAAAPGTWR